LIEVSKEQEQRAMGTFAFDFIVSCHIYWYIWSTELGTDTHNWFTRKVLRNY